MSDRDKSGLRGRVSVCETEYRCCPPHQYKGLYVIREVFHLDGRRDETTHEHVNGTDWTHRWFYRDDKSLIEETYDGTFPFRRTFKYDRSGRLDQVFHHGDQGRRLEETYLHHADGTSTQIRYLQNRDDVGRTSSTCSDSMLHVSADAVRVITLRDPQDNPLEEVLYNIDERPIQRVLFVYDHARRLIEEGEACSDNTIRDDFRNLYRYDSQGRCIEKQIETPFHGERQTTTYNKHGDATEVRRTYLDTGIELTPKRPWALHFSYDYDAYGNWLVCRIETRTFDTGETTQRDERRRRVTYWD